MTARSQPSKAGDTNGRPLTETTTSEAAREFHNWRNKYNITDIKNKARNNQARPTVAVLATGGCIDTIAAIKAGFKPIWATEVCPERRKMWEDLTGTTCYGDTFKQDYNQMQRPDYLTSGQPCTDYSRSGSCSGDQGETGWMFTAQTQIIQQLQPKAFRLEISDNIVNVHGGREIKEVIRALKQHYVITTEIIPVWHYGDCTTRRRLFTVGLHRELDSVTHTFQFPAPTHTSNTLITFRDIAAPDSEVPEEYWRHDEPTRVPWRDPTPTTTHKIAQTGSTMGHSTNPNSILSWEALGNTQTTYNGGARRPRLDWAITEDGLVGDTRLTVPIETVRAAALPDDYLQWCRSFRSDDEYLQACVNNGTPNRTGYAIDKRIFDILQHTNQPTACAAELPRHGKRRREVRSTMLDTGCNLRLHQRSVEGSVKHARRSKFDIKVASNDTIRGAVDGELTMRVLNSEQQPGIPQETTITRPVTTVSDLPRELFTVDDYYREGYSILLRHPNYEGGVKEIYKPAEGDSPEERIPIRYDWDQSGFWLDYELSTPAEAHSAHTDSPLHYCYDGEQTRAIIEAAQQHDDVIEVRYGSDTEPREYNILGVKSGLRQRKAQLTKKEFHKEYGHLGSIEDCDICKRAQGSMRRITKVIDKHKEQRRAHTWVMDTVTWSHRDNDGSKYMVVLRDKASGTFMIFCIYRRSDTNQAMREWLTRMRSDPAFRSLDYLPVTLIETDRAGEWGLDCAEWRELENEFHFRTIYKPSDRKEEAGTAERACGIVEVVTKAILMQQNLPPQWWVRAAHQAVWLLNRFPSSATHTLTPPDGDQIRPLEACTGGFYSRRQIDRELSYFVAVGTPALIHETKAKGSTLAPKAIWGIAVGMYREAVKFWVPTTNGIRQTKSFTAYKLKDGLNYAQFLGLPAIATTQKSTAIPEDFREQIVVQLPEALESPAEAQREAPVQMVKHTAGAEPPKLTITHAPPNTPTKELGGSVTVLNSKGDKLTPNTITGHLESAHPAAQAPESLRGNLEALERHTKPVKTLKDTAAPTVSQSKLSTGAPYVWIGIDPEVQKLWDELDQQRYLRTAVVTRGTDRFISVCKQHKIPFEHHGIYRDWLLQTQLNSSGGKLTPEQLPIERGNRLPPHLTLPEPHGPKWQKLKRERLKRDTSTCEENEQATQKTVFNIKHGLQAQKHSFRATGTLTFDDELEPYEPQRWSLLHALLFTDEADNRAPEDFAGAAKKKIKKKRQSHPDEPANTREALEHPERGKQWAESMDEEIGGLTRMGVLDHGYTRRDLHKMGITTPPVPLGLYHTHKHDKAGEINRLKTRAAVKGHRGNMKKGIHYFETFAPTPSEDTARVLQCLTLRHNLVRKCGDIEKAYCWAKVPPGELIALSYPEGYRKMDEQGEELFMIMRRNLYGHPAAARAWTRERDSQLLKHFNEDGWTCTQTRMDPCLFLITDRRGKRAWMLIHTDDCDGAGEDEQIMTAIYDKINDIWSVKSTDSEYMLGISRKLTYTKDHISSIELTMTPFIEAMERSFQQHLPPITASTPFPENTKISKVEEIDSEEIQQVLQLGYQRAVGMLLWAARHCYPECKYGVSRLCSVMARPTYRAFRAAMHMIKYLTQFKHRGICYNLNGNHLPIAQSDASNKPDPADGLSQAGFVISWFGGPIATQSKKLKHVGLSSEHNEYMGITSAVKRIVWLRQLLSEMDSTPEVLEKPTVVLADNTQANRICREHFISPGNQYIHLTYHYNKEAVDLGFVDIRWIHTKINIADLFTKPVSRQVFTNLIAQLTGHASTEQWSAILAAAAPCTHHRT
jgi:site-specific DNA-cytosine methylase